MTNTKLRYFTGDPDEFLHEDSPLAKKLEGRDLLKVWHDTVFIPEVQKSVTKSLEDYFSNNIKWALSMLNGENTGEMWRLMNDDLRVAISAIPHASLVLGRSNIEKSFEHEAAGGLNELVKSYVNACLLLIRQEREAKGTNDEEAVSLPFDVEKILPEGVLSISPNEAIKRLQEAGFIMNNGSSHIHLNFHNEGEFLGQVNFSYSKRSTPMFKRTIAMKRRQIREIARKAIE